MSKNKVKQKPSTICLGRRSEGIKTKVGVQERSLDKMWRRKGREDGIGEERRRRKKMEVKGKKGGTERNRRGQERGGVHRRQAGGRRQGGDVQHEVTLSLCFSEEQCLTKF